MDKKELNFITRIIGYARVSTNEQNADLQEQAIKRYALEREL